MTTKTNVNGWIILDKPKGMTSTQVVGKVRWLFKAKKAGHAGTLDPFATGILPIALGEATKLIDFITDGNKEYEFTLKWGEETDSSDLEGTVVAVSDKIPTETEIRKILPQFIGTIKQIPPVYSAIKINGERAYNLARKGQQINMPEREIEIYNLQYLGNNKFRVACSKGTYVRSLGRDIAIKLGTKAHLTELRRTKCGIFNEADKISLETLENMMYGEPSKGFLLPLETSLRDIAVMAVSEEEAGKLKLGQALSPKGKEDFPSGSVAVAVSKNGLAAIVRIEETRVSPIRVFNL